MSSNDLEKLSLAYKSFEATLVGDHLIKWIKEQRLNLLEQAEKSDDQELTFKLTKQAKGLSMVLEHIQSMTSYVNRK